MAITIKSTESATHEDFRDLFIEIDGADNGDRIVIEYDEDTPLEAVRAAIQDCYPIRIRVRDDGGGQATVFVARGAGARGQKRSEGEGGGDE